MKFNSYEIQTQNGTQELGFEFDISLLKQMRKLVHPEPT